MSVFRKLKQTKKASSSPNAGFLPADFAGVLALRRLRVTESKKNDDIYLVCEVFVETTNLDEVAEGSERSILIKLNDRWGYGMADSKSLVYALTHEDPDDIDEDFMLAICDMGDDNEADGTELAGTHFLCVTEGIKTKDGGTFTKHYFEYDDSND